MPVQKLLLVATMAMTSILSMDSSLQAGGSACPVAPAGNWNGRFNYYCYTGGAGGDCSGSYTMGSDTTPHVLGCNGTACWAPITTGAVTSHPEVHIPGSFAGADTDTLTKDPSGDLKTIVHAKFSCVARNGRLRKTFRVQLISHPDVEASDGQPVTLALAQEVKGGGGLSGILPYNPSSPLAASTVPFSNGQVWAFDIPKRVFFDHWISADTTLKMEFDTTTPLNVTGLGISRLAFAPQSNCVLVGTSPVNFCVPCQNPILSRRARRKACR